jgi:hypothetical protein
VGPFLALSSSDKGYPKFPKFDVMLADGEEAQFHHGRDFPTPTPIPYMAGVHGTVIYAHSDRVLVLMPTGEVMHYWDRSLIRQRFRSFEGQRAGFLFPALR